MKNLFLSALMFVGMTGCSTMYFHQHSNETTTTFGEWHHDGILALVEFSDPVDLKERCKNASWKTVQIEETFVQGLLRGITYSLYDPWNVTYSCAHSEVNALPSTPGEAPAKKHGKKSKKAAST